MTREQIMLSLQQEYAARRAENQRAYEDKTERACAHCPGLRALIDARHAAVLGGLRTSLLAKTKDPEANAKLPGTMAYYNAKIAEKLRLGGLGEDALKPEYRCSVCHDEGYVYDPSRRMCNCMELELSRRMLAELGLSSVRQTFERFDPTVFSDTPILGGASQRQAALLARKVCERYADDFPDTETRNLLLMGKSGLGKTYLLNCIACRAAARGVTPTYTSAYHLLEVARQAYIENKSELLSGLMNASLLLIDDLGTEPMMQNITITQLFNLLNERQLAGRHTVISTNFSMVELKERYTERITSRLMDATSWRKLQFIGDDIRKGLKKEAGQA